MHRYVTVGQFEAVINELKETIMGTQADVDALTQVVQQEGQTIAQVATDAAAAHAKLQTEFDALEAQVSSGAPVNLDGLKAAVQANADAIAPLDGAVQALGAITPTPPAPPAPPAA